MSRSYSDADPPVIEMPVNFSSGSRLVETPLTKTFDSFIFWILLVLLAFGPLAFGETEPWSVASFQSGAIVLFLVWCLQQVAARAAIFVPSSLFKPMALFAAVVVIQITFRLSAYRQASIVEGMNYVGYAILLFVAVQLFFYGQRLRLFANALVWYGFAVSVFAILQSVSSNGKIYWLRNAHVPSAVYGPYANRNHYAALMEMLVPFALALCFSRRSSNGKRMFAAFAALLMATSIFLCGSRGGAAAFIVEIIFLAVVNASFAKRTSPGWKSAVLFVLFVAFLFWMDVTPALSRWAALEGDIQAGRLIIAKDCLRMFSAKPLIGWGLGTFPIVYPEFRTFFTDYYINQAHDDWLQVLVETGIAGAIAMLWFVVGLYRDSFAKLIAAGRRSDAGSSIRLAALTGCTAVLVHSLVDFNLHIPANAALFYVLCAIACYGAQDLKMAPD